MQVVTFVKRWSYSNFFGWSTKNQELFKIKNIENINELSQITEDSDGVRVYDSLNVKMYGSCVNSTTHGGSGICVYSLVLPNGTVSCVDKEYSEAEIIALIKKANELVRLKTEKKEMQDETKNIKTNS